jgi:putative ABC transport system permease protein
VGVFRLKTEEEQKGPWNPLETDSEVVLACDAARDLFFRLPEHENQSLQETVLVADRQESVKGLLEVTQKMGLRGYGFLEHIERERMLYLMIFAGMTCVAAVAMIVAALGITNTMFMSVLERTKEIGIMKAVGASNAQMLSMFLIEGTLIGLAGGLAGLFLTWCASFPGDAWIRSMVFRELKVDLKESLFVFPIWLLIAVPFFSVLVTTLAALGPARRAANIDPVVALRHE